MDDKKYPIVEKVESILKSAVNTNATDVHLEPATDGLNVRFRIDGVLQDSERLPVAAREGVVARLKVLSRLLTYRTDIPQEGRIPSNGINGCTVEFRVATFPTIRGERCVVRVFREQDRFLGLEELGFSQDQYDTIKQWSLLNDGMLILCGPAGSGKTSTIYALLKEILASRGNGTCVMTIEDPVEMELEGVTQTEINPHRGLGFADALKGMLRQDPQVMVVGEIRDPKTARIAVQAGLTGQLVITTLHTPNSVSVFPRLFQMGIQPFHVGSSVKGVLSQRLLRRLCRECGGTGCPQCRMTGYSGRTAVGEVVRITPKLRDIIIQGGGEHDIVSCLQDSGFSDIASHAADLVEKEITDKKEVFRIFPDRRV